MCWCSSRRTAKAQTIFLAVAPRSIDLTTKFRKRQTPTKSLASFFSSSGVLRRFRKHHEVHRVILYIGMVSVLFCEYIAASRHLLPPPFFFGEIHCWRCVRRSPATPALAWRLAAPPTPPLAPPPAGMCRRHPQELPTWIRHPQEPPTWVQAARLLTSWSVPGQALPPATAIS